MHFKQEGESTFPICETLEKSGKIKKKKAYLLDLAKTRLFGTLIRASVERQAAARWGGVG